MTASRDPDRLIQQFLLEGAEQLPDQIFDAVRSEIEQQRQRAVIGPWRMPIMNKLVPLGLGAAAVAVALVVGTRLPGAPASGDVGASPSVRPSVAPSVTASPTAAPSATRSSVAVGGLPEGPFVLFHPTGGTRTTVTIPAPGWSGDRSGGTLVKSRNSDPPAGAGLIGPYFGDLYVYGDPCRWSTTLPATPANTVAEAVAALAAQASRNASAPVDITVDGHVGKSMILHVPDDTVDSECDEGKFASWAGGGGPASDGPSRFHQDAGQIDEVWMLDVDGELTVVDAMYGAETPTENIAELRAILQSMTFEK